MTDENQEVTETTEPSLEELASQIEVPEVQQTETVQTDQTTPMPSPDDPEAYAKWSAEQLAATQQQLAKINEKFESEAREKQEAQLKSDVANAVDAIASNVEGLDKEIIEGVLHAKYANNPNFQKIFDNRHSNPQAFETALGVMGKELRDKAAIKVDPQLAENQRALDQSFNNLGSGMTPDVDEAARYQNPAQFEQYWRGLTQQSN